MFPANTSQTAAESVAQDETLQIRISEPCAPAHSERIETFLRYKGWQNKIPTQANGSSFG